VKKTTTDFGRIVRDRRLELDMSQADIAKRVGVDASAVGFWERGTTKPVRKYRKPLAKALGLDPMVLFPDGKF
jgi:ribosome-binding protein aMBF1 (putative translation factor)